jgi:hypothetical protein
MRYASSWKRSTVNGRPHVTLYNHEILLRSSYNRFLLYALMSYLAAKANLRFHLLSSLVSVARPDTRVWLYITYTAGSPSNILPQSQFYQVEIALKFQ